MGTHIFSSVLFLSSVLPGAALAQDAKIPRPAPFVEDWKGFAPGDPTAVPQETERNEAPRPAGFGYLAGLDCEVLLDEPGDGAIWAAADSYKARFDGSGATVVPFFGSMARKSYPVSFHVLEIRIGSVSIPFDGAAPPQREGARVLFDRGAVRERWDLGTASLEQSFEIERPDAPGGDLLVRIGVETDLVRGQDDGGLLFQSELGHLRYGFAVAIDARGERSPAVTSWSGDEIEIRVSAGSLAASRGPLVIDPVISTFTIDTSSANDTSPDVAYDASTANYLVVYERWFSSTDHDILYSLRNADGSLDTAGTIDLSTDSWEHPRVANNDLANQFLTVAMSTPAGGGTRSIRGRTRGAAGSGTVGAAFTINGAESGDKILPDVGGDPSNSAPTYYCVVWERSFSSSDHDIHARIVGTGGAPIGGTILLENSSGTLDGTPAISKSDGDDSAGSQRWNVVWRRLAAPTNGNLYGAQLAWDGTVVSSPFPIDLTATNMIDPSASSLTRAVPRRWMVAYSVVGSASSWSTWGKLLQDAAALDTQDLSMLSSSPVLGTQQQPSVDCDGSVFVVAHHMDDEPGSTSIYHPYVGTFSVLGDRLASAEEFGSPSQGSQSDHAVRIVAAGASGGPRRNSLLVWQKEMAPFSGNIEGARYDASSFTPFCFPGLGQGVIACPCGNPPAASAGCNNSAHTGGATLRASGDVTNPGSVVLLAQGMLPTPTCIFLQGNALIATGTPFGDGVRCAGGTLKRLYVKTASGGQAFAPETGDPSIPARSAALGDPIAPSQKRWYQVYYRDPANYGCASPSTFNATSGVQADW